MIIVEQLEQETPRLSIDSLHPQFRLLHEEKEVNAFYKASNGAPVWGDDGFASDSLLAFIRNIRYYGLLPQDYHFRELSALEGNPDRTPDQRFRREILLTDAFLRLLMHLRSGRLNSSPPKTDSIDAQLLRSAVADGTVRRILQSQEPVFAGYRALKEGLKRMLDGMDIRQRAVVMEGIVVDSIPLHNQLRKVEINLERWRWERASFGKRFIYLNIPSFTLQVVENDTSILESRTVVGKPERPTPVMSGAVQCFITYPYWHVPRKIAVEELLPKIQQDGSYLGRNNFDVLDRNGNALNPDSIDWKKFHSDNFPVVLRQREGHDNALGIIKFVFDNPYAVFLHDTNAPRLFRNRYRALSHGCVRVEKAEVLAHYLVTGKIGKTSPLVLRFLKERARHTVELPASVPIHLRYFTAEFGAGQMHIYEDIYSKDDALMIRAREATASSGR